MEHFTRTTCDLSWKMVIQNPIMTLSTEGNYEVHKPDRQEFVFKRPTFPQQSCEPGEMKVQYMEPSMYHGDKLLVKGRVTGVPVDSENRS